MKKWKAANAEKNRAWSRKWSKNNNERVNELARAPHRRERWYKYLNEYRRNHKPERAAEARRYRAKYRDKVRTYRRSHYEQNKERLLKYRADYIKNHPWFNRAASARHRALILMRMPVWANISEIKKIYDGCPDGMVVDHIIPLRGEEASGTHVPCNLQYLTPSLNGKKSNKLIDIRGILPKGYEHIPFPNLPKPEVQNEKGTSDLPRNLGTSVSGVSQDSNQDNGGVENSTESGGCDGRPKTGI